MKLGGGALNALAHIICGAPLRSTGEAVSPYRTGPELVQFFNEFGAEDVYSQGFPSRFTYVQEKLSKFNGTEAIIEIAHAALEPQHYLLYGRTVDSAAEYLGSFLRFDGLELRKQGEYLRLAKRGASLVRVDGPIHAVPALSREFIDEQLAKCNRKLEEGDYDGAVTNGRTLVEAVLRELHHRLTGADDLTEENLIGQYKVVQRLLNLEPARKDISDSLKQVLTGLASIVNGLSAMRNRMSDAHARTFKPSRHHAKLAINAAQTVVDFLFETLEHQTKLGTISLADRKR